ncbi:MAG: PEP/pyruvate-binding domain-containing protein [bacterium]
MKSAISMRIDTHEITRLVQTFKGDARGPYQAIRWFCPDGTTLPPNQRCPQPGGMQHALHKDSVQKIAKENRIYLGQILAGMPVEDFWDPSNQNSRLKQYQIEKYLQLIDDGWIVRKARSYRGAIQAEDEETWGLQFLTWILAQDEILKSHFFLVRQASKDIPRISHDNRLQTIRTQSKAISDSYQDFIDIRVKIHNQPDAGDVQRVREFRTRHHHKLPAGIDQQLQALEKEIELAYQEAHLHSLREYYEKLSGNPAITEPLKKLISAHSPSEEEGMNSHMMHPAGIKEIAELLWNLRQQVVMGKKPLERLALIDLSNELEGILFHYARNWSPQTLSDALEKQYTLTLAAAGCGFLEMWEWRQIEPILRLPENLRVLTLEHMQERADQAVRAVEWCTNMVRAVYYPEVSLFYAFEPLASGFIDDRIRSSILLNLGEISGTLAESAAHYSGISHKVMGIKNQSQVRGLNPGFAVGELQVITGPPEEVSFSPHTIYAMLRPPGDLKPVAGIVTVSEGNPVSHIQLLCKNLGIPNATISELSLKELLAFSGQKIFYAVSPRGMVLMKPASAMSPDEVALVEVRKREREEISVPVGKIDLKQRDLLNLREVRAYDSGKICGPKAANLGELKRLFPNRVVEGFVIPFGVFRYHLDQHMPGFHMSYWEFLQETFHYAEQERKIGASKEAIEDLIVKRFEKLREMIKKIPLTARFKENLRSTFKEALGAEMGRVPLFIRSDTNMEDLKDFTGAGLNLTVFNVVEEEKILQGIRDVWASPYSERSYRWRQKYLMNPENVYPSVLIIPTVNVEKSGVLITTGVVSSDPKDVTIAFNRGAGGAVEGQMAETYLLKHNGENILLSPSREMEYTILPEAGGAMKGSTHFNRKIVKNAELEQLREFSAEIKKKLPGAPGIETDGPFDVELGFKNGAIWLFQVRPYVENKKALSSAYLRSLDPRGNKNKKIRLLNKIDD